MSILFQVLGIYQYQLDKIFPFSEHTFSLGEGILRKYRLSKSYYVARKDLSDMGIFKHTPQKMSEKHRADIYGNGVDIKAQRQVPF